MPTVYSIEKTADLKWALHEGVRTLMQRCKVMDSDGVRLEWRPIDDETGYTDTKSGRREASRDHL